MGPPANMRGGGGTPQGGSSVSKKQPQQILFFRLQKEPLQQKLHDGAVELLVEWGAKNAKKVKYFGVG